jgi:hypothetical protein
MACIMARRTMAGNDDATVTARHRRVAGEREPALRPVDRTAPPAGAELPDARGGSDDPTTLRPCRRGDLRPHLTVSTVAASGSPSLAFYVDGVRYRTVGTPSDFSDTGAPASSFDRIYVLGSGFANVADAKPGDRDFNGGRWMVLPVTWTAGVTPVQLTSAEQVQAYAAAGMLAIASAPVKLFECPVIAVGGN